VPRAGPLRYWLLTLVGSAIVLASLAAIGWGTYELIGTESCGTRTTQECDSDTALHVMAVTIGPFVGFFGGALLAFRGGTSWSWPRREKRVADMVARGEMAAPVIRRPLFSAPPPPDLPSPGQGPINRLKQLDELKEKGLISAADYETQKKRILGGT
jgi:hypothetical protein